MFHEIQNPKLDSLVHCFKVPDLSMAFGDVSDDNVNDVFSLFDLEELFSRPQDHGAFIFYVDKDKTEDLFNKLTEQGFIESVAEAGEEGLVCVYNGEQRNILILLETNKGETSNKFLEANNGFGHRFHYFEEFFVTIEMFSGEDNRFLVGLENDVELFEFFCKLDVYKD
jgi:hypothetical protein